jgi:hypothetical protein
MEGLTVNNRLIALQHFTERRSADARLGRRDSRSPPRRNFAADA